MTFAEERSFWVDIEVGSNTLLGMLKGIFQRIHAHLDPECFKRYSFHASLYSFSWAQQFVVNTSRAQETYHVGDRVGKYVHDFWPLINGHGSVKENPGTLIDYDEGQIIYRIDSIIFQVV